MTTFELNADGLQVQTEEEIRDELVAKLRAAFGVNIKTKAASLLGQIINPLAELRSVDQQALLAVYRSVDPNGALGRALDARLTLTGSTRLGATKSTVDGLLEWSAAGTMNNGDLIKNATDDELWELVGGPVSDTGGPYPEFVAAQMQAVDTGPKEAIATTTWIAVTVVANLTGFTNPTDDAEPGRDQELDGPARRRRLTELYAQGHGPLLTIGGVVSKAKSGGNDVATYVRVYHNPSTFPVDSDSIPFKAFNVVVETNPTIPTAAQQQALWDAIFSVMGAGGEAYGTDYVGTVTDSEGTSHPVAFDTITAQDIILEVDLITSTTESAISPNLEAVVAAQILATANSDWEQHGRDVLALDVAGTVQAMLVAGTISGVDAVDVRMAISPAGATAVAKLAIGIREKPDFDSANITVIQA